MTYKKNDIVTGKNGYEYVITSVKDNGEYKCIPLSHYNTPYKIHGTITTDSIVKLSGRIYKGSIILA